MSSTWISSCYIRRRRHMARPSHAPLRSSIAKKNTRSKQSSMPDAKGEDISCSTSCTGKATHTLMTHGLHIKTSTPLNSLWSSCIPTLLQLDDQQYKTHHLCSQNPHLPFIPSEPSEELSTAFICPSLATCLVLPRRSLSPPTIQHRLPLHPWTMKTP